MTGTAKDTISAEDAKHLIQIADTSGDGSLSNEELNKLVEDYNNKKITDPRIIEILKKYDSNNDGVIDLHESSLLAEHMSLQETAARYAGYSIGFARAFRYLAFTSDLGEALRPVVSARIVNASYAVALGYCVTDVGWEAYNLHKNNYVDEHGAPMTLTHCVVKRSTFQAVASLALPAFIIHSAVSATKKITAKIGRFGKWGPSIVGLSIVPFLPVYVDHPAEHAIDWLFENHGPWSKKAKSE